MKKSLFLTLITSLFISFSLNAQSVKTLKNGNRMVEVVHYQFPKNISNMPKDNSLKIEKENKGIKIHAKKDFMWSKKFDIDFSRDFMMETELKPTGAGLYARTGGLVLGHINTSGRKSYLLFSLDNEGACSLSWLSERGKTKNIFKHIPAGNKLMGEYKFIKGIKGYRKVKIVKQNGMVQVYLNDKKIKKPIKADLVGNKFGFHIKKNAPLRLRSFKLTYLLEAAPTLAINNLVFTDDNADGALSNSEGAMVSFNLKNTGKTKAYNLELDISSIPGVTLLTPPVIEDIAAGAERTVELKLLGEENISNNSHQLTVTVKDGFDDQSFSNSLNLKTSRVAPVDFQIVSTSIDNSLNSNNFEAFENGKLHFKIKNIGDLNCLNYKWEIQPSTNNQSIYFTKTKGSISSVDAKSEKEITAYWNSGMISQNTDIKIALIITNDKGDQILKETKTLSAAGFINNTKAISGNSYTESPARRKALNYLWGKPTVDFKSFKDQLIGLSQKGDPFAKAWVADLSNAGFWFFKNDRNLAYQLGQESLAAIKSAARSGNAEAIYLSGTLLYYGLGTEIQKEGFQLIKLAAEKNYAPANYLLANIEESKTYGKKALDNGFIPAHSILGQLHQNDGNVDAAIAMYRDGVIKKDPYCMSQLAQIYLKGIQVQPDVEKAISYYEQAKKAGLISSGNNLAMIYLSGEMGKAKDPEKAYSYFKESAKEGNTEAMFMLGLMDIEGLRGYKDLNSGKYWLSKAALLNHAPSMALLGKHYASADIEQSESNQVLSRYWIMEAKVRGEEVGSTGGEYNLLNEVLNNTEWTKTVTTTQYSSGYRTQSESPNIVGDVLGGIFTSYLKSQHSNDKLNASVFIQKTENKQIYAASLNNNTETPIRVQAGQKIQIEGRGKVILGFSGAVTALGSADPMVQGYNRTDAFNHGALMYRIGESGEWKLAGKETKFTAEESGVLYLALNDRKTSDNRNYFDVKIMVEE